jgi:hypothetical protein
LAAVTQEVEVKNPEAQEVQAVKEEQLPQGD